MQPQYFDISMAPQMQTVHSLQPHEDEYDIGTRHGLAFKYQSPVHNRYNKQYIEKYKKKEIAGIREWVR